MFVNKFNRKQHGGCEWPYAMETENVVSVHRYYHYAGYVAAVAEIQQIIE